MSKKMDRLTKLFSSEELNREEQLKLRGGYFADDQTSGATTEGETVSGTDEIKDDCDLDWSDEGFATGWTDKGITTLP